MELFDLNIEDLCASLVYHHLKDNESGIRDLFLTYPQPVKIFLQFDIKLKDVVEEYELQSLARNLVFKFLLEHSPESAKLFGKLVNIEVNKSLPSLARIVQKYHDDLTDSNIFPIFSSVLEGQSFPLTVKPQ